MPSLHSRMGLVDSEHDPKARCCSSPSMLVLTMMRRHGIMSCGTLPTRPYFHIHGVTGQGQDGHFGFVRVGGGGGGTCCMGAQVSGTQAWLTKTLPDSPSIAFTRVDVEICHSLSHMSCVTAKLSSLMDQPPPSRPNRSLDLCVAPLLLLRMCCWGLRRL